MIHDYEGEVVRATIVERDHCRLKGRILTGHAEGHVVPIMYTGDTKQVPDTLLVRMHDHPQKELNNRPLEAGFFVSSEIPDGFEYMRSEGILFHGEWTREMRNGFPVPNVSNVLRQYNIGYMPNILFYTGRTDLIVPWSISGKKGPLPCMTGLQDANRNDIPKTVEASYRRYKREVENYDRGRELPRIVIIDQPLSLEQIAARIRKVDNLFWLKMEPQYST